MDFEDAYKMKEILERRKKLSPFEEETNKLFAEIFPAKKFEQSIRLGIAYALSYIKKDIGKHMCEDCNKIIDLAIEKNKEDDHYNYLKKFLE